MNKTAFAIVAHPDDIEINMAGTMLQLARRGWALHYVTLANGSCGTVSHNREEIIAIRTAEAREGARMLGAVYYPPLVDDLMIYYTPELVASVCAMVRQANPSVLLVQHPSDYMEDHTNAQRLAVTAAFCRNMRNFVTVPHVEPVLDEVAVYHGLPHGLTDTLRNPVRASFYVDITDVLETKTQALACHRSQKEWLDRSQGMDSYLITSRETSATIGSISGRFRYAEGWIRHSHWGFCGENFDPLHDALADIIVDA